MKIDINNRLCEIERNIAQGNFPDALSLLNNFIIDCSKSNDLESHFPEFRLNHVSVTTIPEISPFTIRLISIIQCVLLSDKIVFDQTNTAILIHFKDWITGLFSFSPLGSTDYIINSLSSDNTYSGEKLWRLATLYTSESKIHFDWNVFFNENRTICMILALSLLSSSQFITNSSATMRDNLLTIIPKLIDKLDSLDSLPIELLHHAYMRCSYSTIENKHAIKFSIINLIRRDFQKKGYIDAVSKNRITEKPTMIVILDWWTSTHAMYRCYSEAIISLSKRFKLIALAHKELVDEAAISIFDEVYYTFSTSYSADSNFTSGYNKLKELCPDVIYFPSVGMSLATLFFSAIRLAPLQIASCGHPATTGSPCIDYMISFPEFYGDQSAYCEKVRLLPQGAFSFGSISHNHGVIRKECSDTIQIAITASVYKLNPYFLDALKQIEKLSTKKVKFNFYLASVYGLHYVRAKKSLLSIFSDSSVYPNQNHSDYISSLAKNHIFLSPFPFGNTNGIVDAVSCNIPGVCLYGNEPHSASDKGMFEICGLPDILIAYSIEQYINVCLRLINDRKFLAEISKNLKSKIDSGALHSHGVDSFGENILDLYNSLASRG